MYTPDRWIIINIGLAYKVLGGFRGGYLDGDSWRASSGITTIEEEDDYYVIHNLSGSQYKCFKQSQGTTALTAIVYEQVKDKVSQVEDMEALIKELGDGS